MWQVRYTEKFYNYSDYKRRIDELMSDDMLMDLKVTKEIYNNDVLPRDTIRYHKPRPFSTIEYSRLEKSGA